MRFLVVILGLVGVGGAALTGSIRLKKIDEELKPALEIAKAFTPADKQATDPKFQEAVAIYNSLTRSTYALLGAAAVGLVACILALMRKGMLAGVLFLLAYAAPLVFLQEKVTALFPVGLLLAGLLSFMIRKPRLDFASL